MRWSAYFHNCVGKKKYLNPLYWYHTRRYTRLGVKLGFSIGVNSLGYGAVLPHYGTIVVNGDCTLGNYCVLHTSTCIAGSGKIGDALYLSTGGIIVSSKLGNNVCVGVNSMVHKINEPLNDVLYVGSPAIIKREGCIPWYIRDGWEKKVKYIEEVKQINKM